MKKLYKFVANSTVICSHSLRTDDVRQLLRFFPWQINLIIQRIELAEKIWAHKWYREGRITETIEEDEDVIHDENDVNSVLQETEVNQRYSILGKRMCTYIPPASSGRKKELESAEPTKEKGIQEDRDIQEDIENVTSFSAKDFFEVRFSTARNVEIRRLCPHYAKSTAYNFPIIH